MHMDSRGAASLGRDSWDTWPTYESAALGFRGYWYPVAWSASLGRKPMALTLLGEPVGATLLAAVLPGIREVPGVATVVGGALIVAGVYVAARIERVGRPQAVPAGHLSRQARD